MLEESDNWHDFVMYLSNNRVWNEQGAIKTENVESSLANDCILQVQFAIVGKVVWIS